MRHGSSLCHFLNHLELCDTSFAFHFWWGMACVQKKLKFKKQIKATRCHVLPINLVKLFLVWSYLELSRCEETNTLVLCWHDYKLPPLFGRQFGNSFQVLKAFTFVLSSPWLGLYCMWCISHLLLFSHSFMPSSLRPHGL